MQLQFVTYPTFEKRGIRRMLMALASGRFQHTISIQVQIHNIPKIDQLYL